MGDALTWKELPQVPWFYLAEYLTPVRKPFLLPPMLAAPSRGFQASDMSDKNQSAPLGVSIPQHSYLPS